MGSPVVHFEVTGRDGPALGRFYADLFGWTFTWMPEMSYGLVDTQAGSGINGGIGTSETGQGLVTFYVEVADPQGTLDQVQSLGGKTTMPVMEIPGNVTLAQFVDPQGSTIGLVKAAEAGEEGGGRPSPGEGAPVSWFEVLGPDPAGLASFYGSVFGWVRLDGDPSYFEVDTGSAGRGIPGGLGVSRDGTGHVNVYASVPALEPYCDKATASGGGVSVPPTKMGDQLEFGHLLDPDGNAFGIWRMLG